MSNRMNYVILTEHQQTTIPSSLLAHGDQLTLGTNNDRQQQLSVQENHFNQHINYKGLSTRWQAQNRLFSQAKDLIEYMMTVMVCTALIIASDDCWVHTRQHT